MGKVSKDSTAEPIQAPGFEGRYGETEGYTIRIVRISELAGMLGLFKVPALRGLALKASAGVAKRGVRNLARLAEETAEGR